MTEDGTSDVAPKIPPQLESFLKILGKPSTLLVPVCRGCEAALLPKSLLDHLRKHHQLPAELRALVKSLVAILPPLDFNDIPIRDDGSSPVEALRVVDAFKCKHCTSFIRRDVTDVRKHVNEEHGISAAGSYDKIRAQTWFGGRRAVYWRVCEPDPEQEKFERENLGAMCNWGLHGKGFGHRKPTSWREGLERDLEDWSWGWQERERERVAKAKKMDAESRVLDKQSL